MATEPKHGVYKETRTEGKRERPVWCVYINGLWRGTYPQRKLARNHFDFIRQVHGH